MKTPPTLVGFFSAPILPLHRPDGCLWYREKKKKKSIDGYINGSRSSEKCLMRESLLDVAYACIKTLGLLMQMEVTE